MPTLTTNFSYQKPLVNNATDADLWGGQLNTNWDDIDTDISLTTSAENSGFTVLLSEFNNTFLIDASGGSVTGVLPSSAPFSGWVVRFKATDISNTVTVGGGGLTIDGESSVTIDTVDNTIEVISDGSNYKITTKDVDFAVQAGVETGTNAVTAVTPKALRDALGFSKSFVSSNQTITSAGQIVLAHGFAIRPRIVTYELECLTAEGGYSIGDFVGVDFSSSSVGNNAYNNPVLDTTNITIRYSDDVNVFRIANKTTGASFPINNANWKLIVSAWG